jgi:hypothetical protein
LPDAPGPTKIILGIILFLFFRKLL